MDQEQEPQQPQPGISDLLKSNADVGRVVRFENLDDVEVEKWRKEIDE